MKKSQSFYTGVKVDKTGATKSNGTVVTAFPKGSYMDKYIHRKDSTNNSSRQKARK